MVRGLFFERCLDGSFELSGVVGNKVGQVTVFRVTPAGFGRIEFGGVSR